MGRQQNIIAAVVTDPHLGSSVGLRPRICSRDDGDPCQASAAQSWLLSRWQDDYWPEVFERRKRLDALLFLLHFGDLFEGIHHHNTQLWSSNSADWHKAADELFNPIMEQVDYAFFVRGTEAHSGPSACEEEKWVNSHKWNNVVHEPITKAATWWYLDVDLGGVRIEGAHHGPLGRMSHTEGNPLNKISSQIMAQAHKAGRKPPMLYFQAHNHIYAENNVAMPVRVIALPAWQLLTGLVSRISPYTQLADIGGAIVEIVDGEYNYDVRVYKPTPRSPWIVPEQPKARKWWTLPKKP